MLGEDGRLTGTVSHGVKICPAATKNEMDQQVLAITMLALTRLDLR